MKEVNIAEAFEWGIRQFKRYARHEMTCNAWGPGGAVRTCTCGVVDTIEKAEQYLAGLKSKMAWQ